MTNAIAIPAGAALIYDEADSGDLSDDGAAPSQLAFSLGENEVRGQVGLVQSETDLDLFRFVVPTGARLVSIRFDKYEEAPDIAGGSFLAIASGSSVSTSFGSTHLSNVLVDSTGEWLDDLASGSRFTAPSANVTGLTAPLAAGEYILWFEEISTRIDYSLTVTIAVPEPSASTIGVVTAMAWMAPRRKRLPPCGLPSRS